MTYLVIISVRTDHMGNLCPIPSGGGMHCVNNHRQTDKAIHASRQTGGVVIEKDHSCNIMMEFHSFIHYILLLIDHIEGMEW